MKKYYIIAASVVLVIVAAFYFFFSSRSEIDKAIKSLNAQNYDMAIAKLKEIVYEDEDNFEAKGLLFYAQARKYFDENEISTFKKVIKVSFSNMLTIKKLIFQKKMADMGLLGNDEKELYLKETKDLRKQLMKYSIPTEDMGEIEELLKLVCETGVKELKLSQGDEVDQALYAFLLAGNSFFGDKESSEKLIKLAKMNEDVQPLFLLCGNNISESLREEAKNDESLVGQYAKYLFVRSSMKDKINELFTKYNKMQSALKVLKEQETRNYSNTGFSNISYSNNEIFFEDGLFQDFLKYSEINKKVGIDVSIYLLEANTFVSAYFYNPTSKKYISKFYSLIENELKEVSFDNKEIDFTSAIYPVTLYDFDKEKQILKIADHKLVKKTGYRTEQKYNPEKYYSYYSGYSGGYDYVQVAYEYDDLENVIKSYSINKDKALLIPEDDANMATAEELK